MAAPDRKRLPPGSLHLPPRPRRIDVIKEVVSAFHAITALEVAERRGPTTPLGGRGRVAKAVGGRGAARAFGGVPPARDGRGCHPVLARRFRQADRQEGGGPDAAGGTSPGPYGGADFTPA